MALKAALREQIQSNLQCFEHCATRAGVGTFKAGRKVWRDVLVGTRPSVVGDDLSTHWLITEQLNDLLVVRCPVAEEAVVLIEVVRERGVVNDHPHLDLVNS